MIDPANHGSGGRSKTKKQHLLDIEDESADPQARARAIGAITFDRRYEFEPLLRKLVEHSSYVVRGEAIRRLLFTWSRIDLLDRAIEMALYDPSEYARRQALGALMLFANKHADNARLKQRIVSVLVRALKQEPQIDNQMKAHGGILKLLDGNEDYAPNSFDREHDVDWERLREFED